MRGSYDSEMDVYYGPSSLAGPPGTLYRFAVPCRLVPQTMITQVDWPLLLELGWVTYDGPPLYGPGITGTLAGVAQYDLRQADQVALPSGGPVLFVVCRGEHVVPTDLPVRPGYYRHFLVPLPLPLPPPPPPPPPGPGSTCATALAILPAAPYSGATALPPGTVQWFICTGLAPGPCHLTSTGILGSPVAATVVVGSSCGTLGPPTPVVGGHTTFVLPLGSNAYLSLAGSPAGPYVYTLEFGNGP